MVNNSFPFQAFVSQTLERPGPPFQTCRFAHDTTLAHGILDADRTVDLLLNDLDATGDEGERLIDSVLANRGRRPVAVIAISADATPGRIESLLDRGVSTFIRKPFTAETLRREVYLALDSVVWDGCQPAGTGKPAAFRSRLCCPNSTPEQRPWVEEARPPLGDLLQLVNGILDTSLLDSRRVPPRRETFSLLGELEEAFSLVGSFTARDRLSLGSAREYTVYGDRLRFQRVICRLLAHAVEVVPESRRVCVETSKRGADCLIRIYDTDVGTGQENRDAAIARARVVGPSRRNASLSAVLSACKRLLDCMGGRIWTFYEPGPGNIFEIAVPLVSPSPARLAPDLSATHLAARRRERSANSATLELVVSPARGPRDSRGERQP